jgi:hypothetical protein
MMIERMCLSGFLDDFVAYRTLAPSDRRLRGLSAIHAELGLPAGRIPRKTEPEYAAAVVHLLRQAQSVRSAGRPLERVLYIGDTRLNDGTAARNLARHLSMRAFIGEDKPGEAIRLEAQDEFVFANRWTALGDFLRQVQEQGFALDAATAVVLDLDKTAIGARGRNDKPIDQARVDAALDIARATLGPSFRLDTFRPIYDELHKPAYHFITTDNQDYLVYFSLMASAGVYDGDTLLADLKSKRLNTFAEFVAVCDKRLQDFPALQPLHVEVEHNLRQGDPTPFKSFRYREYECTLARMDKLPDDTPRAQLLAEEITLTREVADAALELRERGALLFGLSDKPDEASLPRPELAQRGYVPLHHAILKVIGPGVG